jgi:ribosome modulation factor
MSREPSEDRLRRAFEDGYAAAARGEEAAPGCTTTAEGRAFLRGYVEGAKMRPCDAPTSPPPK